MSISLNSPKYADTKSLAYQMHKKQQDRKRRKNPFEPQAEERFFRHNEGGTDYYSHAVVTVDRIVMDVMPLSGGAGLPTGAPAVTNGVLQTIDFVYSGTISELCRNGAIYFAGVMANVEYYFGGAQIHGYDIKSNSNNIPDTVGSNNATVINGNADDWSLLTQQNSGDWIGVELITQQVWENPVASEAQWSFSNNRWTLNGDGSISQLEFILASNQPNIMVLSGECLSVSGHLAVTSNNAGQTGITSTGLYSFDLDKSEIDSQLFKRHTGIVSATISKPSLREVLRIA